MEQEWVDAQKHMSKMRFLLVFVCYLHMCSFTLDTDKL